MMGSVLMFLKDKLDIQFQLEYISGTGILDCGNEAEAVGEESVSKLIENTLGPLLRVIL